MLTESSGGDSVLVQSTFINLFLTSLEILIIKS